MLKITQAKPNPAGKDRRGLVTPKAQLAGEWVDIANSSSSALNMGGLQVYHRAYTSSLNWEWERVTTFHNFQLPAYQTVRVHSGEVIPLNQMNPIDITGADVHVFTGKDYVWNNRQPDQPTLFNPGTKQNVDQALYDAPVPEGRILKRNGDKLI